MTKTTLYTLGIFITLLLGTYFFQRLCSDCRATRKSLSIQGIILPTAPENTSYIINSGLELKVTPSSQRQDISFSSHGTEKSKKIKNSSQIKQRTLNQSI